MAHDARVPYTPHDMKRTSCRICKGGDLHCFLDLGFHPHADQFRVSLDEAETTYPLRVVRCRGCGFVQLDYVVPPSVLYQADYLYESSITKTGDLHWTTFARAVSGKAGLRPGDGVVDVGSNDGTLLSKFQGLGMKVCGIDPCAEIAAIAVAREVPTVGGFLCGETLREAAARVGRVRCITAANVFAHIDDLDGTLDAVAAVLGDGTFVFESPYLGDLLEGLQYDTIYHQHLSYLPLRPLISFFRRHGLEIFDVERTPIHGGSFRVFAGRDRKPGPCVQAMAEAERWTEPDFERFGARARAGRDALFEMLHDLSKAGKRIAAVSAPAKGQTLLNYAGVGRFLEFATDKSKLKQGRFTPGTHLEIFSDDELIARQPDYALLLAWNFAEEIMGNNPAFRGRWIIPIPHPRVV